MLHSAVLCVLSAKYIHAPIAPYCLAAGVRGLQNKIDECSIGNGAQSAGENAENTANGQSLPEMCAKAVGDERIMLKTAIVDTTVQRAGKEQHKIAEEIVSHSPVLVGFSCYIWNIEQTLSLAKAVKLIKPSVKIVLGGPEVSYNASDVLNKNEFVDYVISGEGEESFAQLFLYTAMQKQLEGSEGKAQDNNRKYAQNMGALLKLLEKLKVDGLCTRQFITEPCVIQNYNNNPVSGEYLNALNGRIAYIEASRGCPYSCAFCLSGRCGKPRYFNIQTVFDNIVKLANSGAKTVKFVDRTFNANAGHANAILSFILENYSKAIKSNVCFHFEIAADILREDTLAILSKMPHGAVQLEIGMQSFNEKTLATINRKTDTQKVRENIEKLVKMGNMHIHIDLIAGLAFENLISFKHSFNTGYALKANVMQLGFLKVLFGSAIGENPKAYECEYTKTPPYEVKRTKWLSEDDMQTIKFCENELERIYNSGRFRRTAAFAIAKTGKTPFDFYSNLGRIASNNGIAPHGVSLDDYTEFLYKTLCDMPEIKGEEKVLRDEMVRDRLATNAGGKLPKALHVKDDNLGKAVKALEKNEKTARKSGVKRAVAILYGAQKVLYVDYIQKNHITHEYILHEINIDNVLH